MWVYPFTSLPLTIIFFSFVVEYVMSQRGKTLIKIGNYTFCNFKTYQNGKTRWVCSTHKPTGCRAFLCTFNDAIISVQNMHTHKWGRFGRKSEYIWFTSEQREISPHLWNCGWFHHKKTFRVIKPHNGFVRDSSK